MGGGGKHRAGQNEHHLGTWKGGGGGGWNKTKAPVLPACSQQRHNTATLHVVTPLNQVEEDYLGSPSVMQTLPPSSLIPLWAQIIAKGATGHLQADSQLL